MKRDSFVFYRSFMEALNDLPPKEYKAVMMVIQQYAFDGIEPNLTGVAKVVFNLVKPQIEANNKRYENGCKGAEYGALGGRPRKEINPKETPNDTPPKPPNNPKKTPSKPQVNPTKTPNDNVNVNVNVNDNNINNNKKEKTNKDAGESAFKRKILENLSETLPDIVVGTFFESMEIIEFLDDTVLLKTTKLLAEAVDARFKTQLENAIQKASNGEFIYYSWGQFL